MQRFYKHLIILPLLFGTIAASSTEEQGASALLANNESKSHSKLILESNESELQAKVLLLMNSIKCLVAKIDFPNHHLIENIEDYITKIQTALDHLRVEKKNKVQDAFIDLLIEELRGIHNKAQALKLNEEETKLQSKEKIYPS